MLETLRRRWIVGSAPSRARVFAGAGGSTVLGVSLPVRVPVQFAWLARGDCLFSRSWSWSCTKAVVVVWEERQSPVSSTLTLTLARMPHAPRQVHPGRLLPSPQRRGGPDEPRAGAEWAKHPIATAPAQAALPVSKSGSPSIRSVRTARQQDCRVQVIPYGEQQQVQLRAKRPMMR